MPYDPDRHHRRSIRLHGFDYRLPGLYFVTLCAYRRAWLFGQVDDGTMVLNAYGRAIAAAWKTIPRNNPHVRLDAFQVMPNHIHGIIEISALPDIADAIADASQPAGARPRGPSTGSLGAILAGFKATATRRINALRHVQGEPIWQCNYWEHVVRNEDELVRIRTYIVSNPALWVEDRLYGPAEGDPPSV